MVVGFAAGFYKNPSQRSDLEMGKENSSKNLAPHSKVPEA
mgnify:CR=1 FL=1|jgi:hypothetical protein